MKDIFRNPLWVIILVVGHLLLFAVNLLALIFHRRIPDVDCPGDRLFIPERRSMYKYCAWLLDISLVMLVLFFIMGIGGSITVFWMKVVMIGFVGLVVEAFFCLWLVGRKLGWIGDLDSNW
jgi:hypothetical protein